MHLDLTTRRGQLLNPLAVDQKLFHPALQPGPPPGVGVKKNSKE